MKTKNGMWSYKKKKKNVLYKIISKYITVPLKFMSRIYVWERNTLTVKLFINFVYAGALGNLFVINYLYELQRWHNLRVRESSQCYTAL